MPAPTLRNVASAITFAVIYLALASIGTVGCGAAGHAARQAPEPARACETQAVSPG